MRLKCGNWSRRPIMRTVTSQLGIELPVVLVPMAGVPDGELAIAVSSPGGLGSMPCAMLGRARLGSALRLGR